MDNMVDLHVAQTLYSVPAVASWPHIRLDWKRNREMSQSVEMVKLLKRWTFLCSPQKLLTAMRNRDCIARSNKASLPIKQSEQDRRDTILQLYHRGYSAVEIACKIFGDPYANEISRIVGYDEYGAPNVMFSAEQQARAASRQRRAIQIIEDTIKATNEPKRTD